MKEKYNICFLCKYYDRNLCYVKGEKSFDPIEGYSKDGYFVASIRGSDLICKQYKPSVLGILVYPIFKLVNYIWKG